MKDEKAPNASKQGVLGTFGGDYHRLESDFQKKTNTAPTPKDEKVKRSQASRKGMA